jgi:uncharacterized Ntn-hydrolase superfamily protein
VTYSIVARDPATGELGVAAQSHWFSVGSIVTWAGPGVGAVATQSIPDPGYGERLLSRLAAGESPGEALGAELAADELARFRQVAVVDAAGRTAAHTGRSCIAYAGDADGDGYSAQANMMASERVWPAMAGAFEASSGSLARRLMAALEAGEEAGGDVRGRQSAAMLVVPDAGVPWQTTLDLRVEDYPEPLAELRRLIGLNEAYALADRADEAAGEGRSADAADLYLEAAALAPDRLELAFWAGLGLAAHGDLEEGADRVRRTIEADPAWGELLARLDDEIAPSASAVREALGIRRAGA